MGWLDTSLTGAEPWKEISQLLEAVPDREHLRTLAYLWQTDQKDQALILADQLAILASVRAEEQAQDQGWPWPE